jgi:hypothetical protein
MSNPFDYVNQIMQGKKNLIVDELTESQYNPFLTNRSLSYHFDCILYSNEMNQRHHLDNKLQNDYFINTIRSQKRPFAKWVKSEKNEDLECLKLYFGFSTLKARESVGLISDEDIQKLKEKTDIGGIRKQNG